MYHAARTFTPAEFSALSEAERLALFDAEDDDEVTPLLSLSGPAIVRTRFIRDIQGTNHRVAVEVIGTDQGEIVPLTRKPKYFDSYHASALFDVFGDAIDVVRKREHGSTSGQADVYWDVVPV